MVAVKSQFDSDNLVSPETNCGLWLLEVVDWAMG